ncbi:hypothetical protein CYMTET_30918 [Cymbomonas tetramitiformis]|uniref:Uncharacterized protein n=1 Tax=Cymbomonas tetramitiformis TaxID=36881 RepID=A0AAE0FI21_9CHLO|nr:hypothetical protein CYMTET_30918 [Cymbomonas tetramitiformis]
MSSSVLSGCSSVSRVWCTFNRLQSSKTCRTRAGRLFTCASGASGWASFGGPGQGHGKQGFVGFRSAPPAPESGWDIFWRVFFENAGTDRGVPFLNPRGRLKASKKVRTEGAEQVLQRDDNPTTVGGVLVAIILVLWTLMKYKLVQTLSWLVQNPGTLVWDTGAFNVLLLRLTPPLLFGIAAWCALKNHWKVVWPTIFFTFFFTRVAGLVG